jgi:hypothetical protein
MRRNAACSVSLVLTDFQIADLSFVQSAGSPKLSVIKNAVQLSHGSPSGEPRRGRQLTQRIRTACYGPAEFNARGQGDATGVGGLSPEIWLELLPG